jgi:hypothetical protein
MTIHAIAKYLKSTTVLWSGFGSIHNTYDGRQQQPLVFYTSKGSQGAVKAPLQNISKKTLRRENRIPV